MKVICVKGCALVDHQGRPKACGHTLSVRFQYQNKQIKRSLKTKNLREAEKRAYLEVQEVEEEAWLREKHPERLNERQKPPIPSLAEFARLPENDNLKDGGMWWSKFAASRYAGEKPRPKSVRFYRSRIRALLRFKPIAACRLDQIDRSLIDDFISERVETCSNNTVNQDVEVLEFVLRKAQTWKLIGELPEFPKGDEKLPVLNIGRAIQPEEEKLYFAALARAGYRDLSDLARLSIETSMEPGPVLVGLLQWAHIEFENLGEDYEYGRIHDPFTKRITRQRNLPMNPLLAQTLRERWLRMGRPESGLVFEDREHPGKSLSYDTLLAQHQRLWKRGWLEIPYFRPYDLRHTFLTRVHNGGGDRYDVQAWAGWASPHSTVAGVYLHENADRLGRSRARVDRYVEKLRRKA